MQTARLLSSWPKRPYVSISSLVSICRRRCCHYQQWKSKPVSSELFHSMVPMGKHDHSCRQVYHSRYQEFSSCSLQFQPKLFAINESIQSVENGQSFKYLGRHFDFEMKWPWNEMKWSIKCTNLRYTPV